MPVINGMPIPHRKECKGLETGKRTDCDCVGCLPTEHNFVIKDAIMFCSYCGTLRSIAPEKLRSLNSRPRSPGFYTPMDIAPGERLEND